MMTKLDKRITLEIDGRKITAAMGTFNLLSIWAREASVTYHIRGCVALENAAARASMEIYDELDKRGLYD